MKPVDPRVLPLLTPARYSLAGVIGSGVLSGGLVAAQAFSVAALVTGLLSSPAGTGWHTAAWWLLGISAARAVVGACGDVAAAHAAGQVTRSLRMQVLRAATDLGTVGLSRRRSGELGLLATRGVAAVEPYLTRFLPTLVVATVLPPLTLALILSQDLWAGVIVVCTLPLVPVFAILIGLATRDRADRQYRTLSRLAGHFVDVVRGLPTLVTYNRAQVQSRRIRAVTDRYRQATLETLKLAFASSGALELIATLSVALVAVSVGLRLATGGLDLRTALVVLLLAPEAYWPLRRVGAEFHSAAEGVATLVSVTALLDEAAAVRSADADAAQPEDPDRVDPVPLHLRDVVVSYPGSTRPALVVPEATIPAPGLTAIVGPSGCGKSTLVQALLGERPLDSGSITLAGEPVDVRSWRHLVAQVPQVPWLTAGTVADNLRIGRPEATDPELWRSLAAVGLEEVVATLPLGLETPLGEDGAGLSAGQRARLALARVVLANRPYVILDEPTAHLDAETEQIMLATLTRLARHAIVVVVAHRAAVIGAADHLVVLTTPAGEAVTPPAEHDVVVPAAAAVAGTADPEPAETPVPAPVHARRRLALATALATAATTSGVALTATAGWLIAKSAQHPPVLYLMVAIVCVRTFGLARPALRYAERLVSHDVALRMLADTRARVYDVLVPLSPARLGRHRGDLLTAVVDDVDAQLDEQLRVRQPLLAALGTSLVACLVALLVHPVSVVPVALVAFAGGGTALLLGWLGSRRAEAAFVTERAALSAEVVAGLQSARQLVLWEADDAAVERVGRIGTRLAAASRATARALAAARGLLVVLSGAAVVATAWLTAPGLAAREVSGPMTAMLLLLPLALHDVLVTVPEAGSMGVRTRAARERLAALEALAPAVTEPATPATLSGPCDLRLEHASLAWSDQPVVTGLDLHLAPGQALGVVGPSGCGKSTLAATLVRHLAPRDGAYLLAEQDAQRLGSAEVRRHVGLVDDNPYVFASSLRENLRLASPAADDLRVLAALRAAGLGAWYADLPEGLDTLLGDGATDVSGGERARIGIARALLADPEVLVLDEPTAHLDTATARAVTDTVLAARGDGPDARRSLVWITHEEVGLAEMDRVLTLSDRGQVVSGSAVLERPVADGPVAEG
ncbi:thiol reductant ABC exporter subunit CydD [Nocardioides pocheonensis]|uniref:Thiol reductant ABC exporter subunit CydD n=1 Tax=Nocardioides pocheonensis TaxID=661485 RepID=A0A3N0GUT3_9ACTN|nr:thiol reductant ABC exporter subunit CydD [Nocardioides pocheonensis]RNM15902.1 thiol reductant ABC exporter subunit CydD [Nocardioides pocheonensis]